MSKPEALARSTIDELLTAAGWEVEDRAQMNLYTARGVAVREFPLATGYADYLLFAGRKVVGTIFEGVGVLDVTGKGGFACNTPQRRDGRFPCVGATSSCAYPVAQLKIWLGMESLWQVMLKSAFEGGVG